MACPGWDAIDRGGSARPAPKRGVPAGLRPRASGRDGPEHPAAVPEVPRHCPPLRATANGRILAPIADSFLSVDFPAQVGFLLRGDTGAAGNAVRRSLKRRSHFRLNGGTQAKTPE